MGGPLSGDCFWRVSATLLSVTILLYIPYYYVGRWMAPVKRKAELVTIWDSFPALLVINVGGVPHRTAIQTVRHHRQSMLARWFSATDKESSPPLHFDAATGEFFLDRDGRWFGHVLAYLRHGRADLSVGSLSIDDRMALHTEAEFYGLPELQTAVAVAQAQSLFFELLHERETRAHAVAVDRIKDDKVAADFLGAVQQILANLVKKCPHEPLQRCQWQIGHQPLAAYPDPYALLPHFADLLRLVGLQITISGTHGLPNSFVAAELRLTEPERHRAHKYFLPIPS